MRHPVYILAAAVFLAAAGCAVTTAYKNDDAAPGMDAVAIEGVPAFKQAQNQCGPAALASVLVWSGIDVHPSDLSEKVYDPGENGTLQISLVAAARRHGRVAYEIDGMDELRTELTAGNPVLVLMNQGLSWWPVYHYAVVSGLDPLNNHVVLAAGKAYKETMRQSHFRRMWDRGDNWGVVVVCPETLPATATEARWLDAVYGLELAGRHEAALDGYSTGLAAWPESLGAMMGKANALYALDRLSAAGDVLARAAEAHPDAGPVFNNLARVKLDQEELSAAVDAAVRAVEIGGPHKDAYMKTLESVHEAMALDPSATP